MAVLSDMGIPRSVKFKHDVYTMLMRNSDTRHISGNGVHTYRFINAEGKSTLFKWYWVPKLGHRAMVYDEATKLAGKNNNFQRIDLYNTIETGLYPEWDFAVQLFPDDGEYMYKGIDLLDATQVRGFLGAPWTILKTCN